MACHLGVFSLCSPQQSHNMFVLGSSRALCVCFHVTLAAVCDLCWSSSCWRAPAHVCVCAHTYACAFAACGRRYVLARVCHVPDLIR